MTTLHLPPETPLLAVYRLAQELGLELRYKCHGNIVARPQTNSNIVPIRRYQRVNQRSLPAPMGIDECLPQNN